MPHCHEDVGPGRIRLLITAFGAFPGAPRNPTGAIAQEFQRRHARRLAQLGIDIDIHLLPVRYDAVAPALERLCEACRPDAVLHLGLAGRRKVLSVETRAHNRLSLWRPDAGRALPPAAWIVAGAPASLAARWPAQRIRAAMQRHASTQISIDAGDYVCNQTLFLTLWRSPVPAGFIHVPRPRGRGRRMDQRVNFARSDISCMVEAVAAAVHVMALGLRPVLTGRRAAAMVRPDRASLE